MRRTTVAYLISEMQTQDNKGVWHTKEQRRKVYGDVSSIGQKEWFEGGRNGLNPQLQITLFAYDYANEDIVEVNDVRYTVYRTYQPGNDRIELYLQLKKGNADNG